MKVKISRQRAVILVLAILLIMALSYIALDIYQQAMQEEQLRTFQLGAQYGYEQAIIQIVQQASTCQPVPLYINTTAINTTINVIAVECLQQGLE